jgi:hypothetical protein
MLIFHNCSINVMEYVRADTKPDRMHQESGEQQQGMVWGGGRRVTANITRSSFAI